MGSGTPPQELVFTENTFEDFSLISYSANSSSRASLYGSIALAAPQASNATIQANTFTGIQSTFGFPLVYVSIPGSPVEVILSEFTFSRCEMASPLLTCNGNLLSQPRVGNVVLANTLFDRVSMNSTKDMFYSCFSANYLDSVIFHNVNSTRSWSLLQVSSNSFAYQGGYLSEVVFNGKAPISVTFPNTGLSFDSASGLFSVNYEGAMTGSNSTETGYLIQIWSNGLTHSSSIATGAPFHIADSYFVMDAGILIDMWAPFPVLVFSTTFKGNGKALAIAECSTGVTDCSATTASNFLFQPSVVMDDVGRVFFYDNCCTGTCLSIDGVSGTCELEEKTANHLLWYVLGALGIVLVGVLVGVAIFLVYRHNRPAAKNGYMEIDNVADDGYDSFKQ
mmetsp:Transcript_51722/g.129809  ORF Transcript_51722/g.129809 Transcript_51722/m.129809 type:complete len:393 (-) Transcript_51722:43-1221(-)